MSELKQKPPKICKCGHEKKLHITNQTFKITGACQSCPCSSYLNRKCPTKADKYLAIFGAGMIMLIMFTAIEPFLEYNDVQLAQTVELPVSTLYLILGAMLGFICLCSFFPLFIGTYLDARKRKEYPIQ